MDSRLVVRISDLGSLNFYNDTNASGVYNQQFAVGDTITVQYAYPSSMDVELLVRNIGTGQYAPFDTMLLQDDLNGYTVVNAVIQADNTGCFEVSIIDIDGDAFATCVYRVENELPGTKLFVYTNEEHKDSTLFDGYFQFRCEADLFYGKKEFLAESNDFRDLEYDPNQLSANAYTQYNLLIGGMAGVPNWVANKLNRIFACTEVYIGDDPDHNEQFIRTEGSGVSRESSEFNKSNPLSTFGIQVEKTYDGEQIIGLPSKKITYVFNGETVIEDVEYGSTVTLKTPQELGLTIPAGYSFDGWTLNGETVTEIEVTGSVTVDGVLSVIVVTLSYFIAEATPSEVVETYDWGTVVQLKTPEELGMTLPEDTSFHGWMDSGEIVTEITLTRDIVMEGLTLSPRANLLSETRRFIPPCEIESTGTQDYIYADYTERISDNDGNHRILYTGYAVGDEYVLSFVIDKKGTAETLSIGHNTMDGKDAYIKELRVNGDILYQNDTGTPAAPGMIDIPSGSENNALVEILLTVFDTTQGEFTALVTAAGTIGGSQNGIRFFKLENVTGQLAEVQRATPWVKKEGDLETLPDSYLTLTFDPDGILIPFSATGTPIGNFSTFRDKTEITINGTAVPLSVLKTLHFGDSYLGVTELPTDFLASTDVTVEVSGTGLRNATSIRERFRNHNTIPNIDFDMTPNVTRLYNAALNYSTELQKLDISAMTKLITLDYGLCEFSPKLTEIALGALDFPYIDANAQIPLLAFSNTPNVPSNTIYAAIPELIQSFKSKYPNVNLWGEEYTHTPLTQIPVGANLRGKTIDFLLRGRPFDNTSSTINFDNGMKLRKSGSVSIRILNANGSVASTIMLLSTWRLISYTFPDDQDYIVSENSLTPSPDGNYWGWNYAAVKND